ncbi:hypothetical protein ZEAMMB73_Zm00001d031037 [Zea mays]|uniref:Uncharacterized protein n=1 Tax=Zea mays TaxID=4577 RepID=A0A1D6KG08_MAIZE|nr:hypothetical protein ZEAMMB73_Zm00001d031037 [Zea mays]
MATLLLQQASKSLASARRGGVLEQRSVRDLMFGGADEEIMVLHAELRAAVQGEERSRKALDDISAALSDVTAEARLVKAWLSEAQVELEATNAEAIRLRAALRAASDERDCYMLETFGCLASSSGILSLQAICLFIHCSEFMQEEQVTNQLAATTYTRFTRFAREDKKGRCLPLSARRLQVVFGKNGGLEQISIRKGYVDMCTVDATTLTKISDERNDDIGLDEWRARRSRVRSGGEEVWSVITDGNAGCRADRATSIRDQGVFYHRRGGQYKRFASKCDDSSLDYWAHLAQEITLDHVKAVGFLGDGFGATLEMSK